MITVSTIYAGYIRCNCCNSMAQYKVSFTQKLQYSSHSTTIKLCVKHFLELKKITQQIGETI